MGWLRRMHNLPPGCAEEATLVVVHGAYVGTQALSCLMQLRHLQEEVPLFNKADDHVPLHILHGLIHGHTQHLSKVFLASLSLHLVVNANSKDVEFLHCTSV